MKNIKNDDIIKIYEKKGCNVSATCTALGISRRTFYNWKDEDPELKQALEEVDESLIDFAESKLMEKISESDLTATIFFLKTKGKSRGYVERVESDVNVNAFEQLMKELPDKVE